jgi:hypothetical protein
LEKWFEMRADWVKHEEEYLSLVKKHGPDYYEYTKGLWEFEMTPCYGGHHFLSPAGYGLTVVDMQKNVILTNQGYTSYGRILAGSLSSTLVDGKLPTGGDGKTIDIGGATIHVGHEDPEEMECWMLYRFWEANRIKHAEAYRKKGEGYEDYQIPMDGVSFEDIIEMCSYKGIPPSNIPEGRVLHFALDMSPYEVHHFGESDPDEWVKFRQRLLDLDFILSDEEEKYWEEWIKEQREEWEA